MPVEGKKGGKKAGKRREKRQKKFSRYAAFSKKIGSFAPKSALWAALFGLLPAEPADENAYFLTQ
jgi:hypothetical protein